MSEEEKEIISTSNHLSQTISVRTLNTENEHSKFLIYINIKLIRLQFVLRRDIFKYKGINLLFFFNHGIIFFLINIYLDDHQFALKYLKNTEVNLNNILIIILGTMIGIWCIYTTPHMQIPLGLLLTVLIQNIHCLLIKY